MVHAHARLGAAALVVLAAASSASAQSGLKPYVVLVLDTSGSMSNSTGAGLTSCGFSDTRLNHARCAINQIANSVGDIVFALGMFRMTTTGTYATNCVSDCVRTGAGTSGGPDCDGIDDDDRFQLLTALVDGNNADAATWTDFSCNTCTTTLANNPEIFEVQGNTPVAGSLLGTQRYWQGLQATNGTPILASGSPGFDPIRTDPLKDTFLPSGEQCRPYIVISLTDGGETCLGNPPAAATALFSTPVDAQTYTIRTKAIGFGQTPGTASIENLAIAGNGGIDKPGPCDAGDTTGCDGFYAQNEQDLSLAISQIVADSVRSERCNGLDDDCDFPLVDEDFPSLGMPCDDGLLGICKGTGTFVCSADETGTECLITTPGQPMGVEVCNNLDDNCNGLIDEGLMCAGCGDAETCNNLDDDCDGFVDEGLNRACGTDVGECTAGTEVCVMGGWTGCTAIGGGPELCNGLDDNCDGTVDGFAQSCTAMPDPPGNPNIGVCHPGTQICAVNGPPPNGTLGPCLGEVVPQPEVCNGLDDNCNGQIDEGTGGQDCSSMCGLGTTICVQLPTPHLECDTQILPTDDTCNGIDDNCNGQIDEGAPPGGPCDAGGTLCNGQLLCLGGAYVCVGDTISPEQCDCLDNNCNGMIDENNGSCPPGSTCTASCQCAFPCEMGEFPCPQGRKCENNFCVIDPCFNVTCPPAPNGDKEVCADVMGTADCVRACDGVACNPGSICYGPSGTCAPDNCLTFPDRCMPGELCAAGTCIANPCAGVTCPTTGEYCLGGTCVASCGSVTCPAGQRCRLGACEPDPCGGPCPFGLTCIDSSGTCENNPCLGRTCPEGEVCDPQTNDCILDPCLGVDCPDDDICRLGTCYDPSAFQPDAAGPEQVVTTGGGGGCSTGGGTPGGLVVVLAALFGWRRRRGGS